MCADATPARTLRSTETERNLLKKEIAGYVFFFREEEAGGGRKGQEGGWMGGLFARSCACACAGVFFSKKIQLRTLVEAAGYVCVCVCVCVWHDIFMRVT